MKTQHLIAGVCILDTPYHADVIYDYWVPFELEDAVVPGCFVAVPFGIRNNVRHGLVAEVRRHSDFKDLKSIARVCPEQIALDEELLGLCEFLKARTLCPTGDAVRAMVPAAAIPRLTEYYTIDPNLPDGSAQVRPSELFLYKALLEQGGSAPISKLRVHLGNAADRTAKVLHERGVLLRRVELDEAKKPKTERFWTLAISLDEAAILLENRATDRHKKLTSPNHKNIVAVLSEDSSPMSTADLCAQAGVNLAQIRAMEEKGIIRCEEREIDRNPYTEAPFVGRVHQPLSEEQSTALETLTSLAFSGQPKAALLHGVTGSGKTRVMTALIDRLLDDGRGVIVLLPEIALTPQSVNVFCSRYGNRVAVIHSALSTGERYDAYRRIRRGEADVVIGTRSAIFAPVKRLGAIIIDEEQEHTYKSDQNPKYLAKDVARYRCAYHNALMLLASATPSLESYKKAMEGAYTLVSLKHRHGDSRLPDVEVVDMRKEAAEGNPSAISSTLLTALSETLQKKEQAVLFLNRRGYHRQISCRSCGKPVVCPNCSVAMTFHAHRYSYREGEMVCHWCGHRSFPPRVCPSCDSPHLGHMGFGTQRVEEELKERFPEARILRMDADTTSSKSAYDHLLGQFRRGEADILLGTQMVTKGHDFPRVTLVGVLLADSSLYVDDYRASERTFAMLTQVVGRAGRSSLAGRAVIQTSNPDHEIIRLAAEQDYATFYEREIRLRRLLCFPPCCDIALITVSCEQEFILGQATLRMKQEFDELRQWETFREVELIPFGPFEAPVYRVDNRYRMRMVIKCRLTARTLEFFSTLLCRYGNGMLKQVRLSIDLNPSSL